jgi:hypothetical protein
MREFHYMKGGDILRRLGVDKKDDKVVTLIDSDNFKGEKP